jgi:hypothetical protein
LPKVRLQVPELGGPDYDCRVTHEVRTVLLIATVIFLTAFVAYFLGLYPLVYLQFPSS